MATTVTWAGGDGANPILAAEAGANDTLGFFGSTFGFSIQVDAFNNTTFVTTDDGSADHGQCPNLRWANATGTFVASESIGTELLEVNDDESTIRIRLTTDSAVVTQNAAFRVFDRTSIANEPSGVVVYAAEIRKGQVGVRGSGNAGWAQISGVTALSFQDRTSETPSTQHDFFVAISVSPDSIGEKTAVGFYSEFEFL